MEAARALSLSLSLSGIHGDDDYSYSNFLSVCQVCALSFSLSRTHFSVHSRLSFVVLLTVRSITGPDGLRRSTALFVKFLGFGVDPARQRARARKTNLESQNC